MLEKFNNLKSVLNWVPSSNDKIELFPFVFAEMANEEGFPCVKIQSGSGQVSSLIYYFERVMNEAVKSQVQNGTSNSLIVKCILASSKRFSVLEREISLCQTIMPVEIGQDVIRAVKISEKSKVEFCFYPGWNYPSTAMEMSAKVIYGNDG